jgi:oligopeptide/dipeptide ABC transporter ATP-binding protein
VSAPPHAVPLLEVRGLTQHFPIRTGIFRRVTGKVRALDDVSFRVERGDAVGIVGESGSGKTTVARAIMRLNRPTAGEIRLGGVDIAKLDRKALRPYRRRMQIIFQDPYASLNPRLRVRAIIGEAFAIHGIGTRAERTARTEALLAKVGLSTDAMRRFPHEFSGGQRQRIGIARALAVEPDLLIADEPVSALDVSIQAQVVNLLKDLRQELGVTLLFIAHDLAVVRYISNRILVMYLGRVMEIAPTRLLFERPRHPYTEALLAAVPTPDPDRRVEREVLQGDIPSPVDPPSGCVFRTRCRYALPACAGAVPPLREVAKGHLTACIRDDVP